MIHLRAVSVSAQPNGLWAATLTEYGPMCKGESAENDLCSARCVQGSNERCMLWWKQLNVLPRHVRPFFTYWILFMNN